MFGVRSFWSVMIWSLSSRNEVKNQDDDDDQKQGWGCGRRWEQRQAHGQAPRKRTRTKMQSINNLFSPQVHFLLFTSFVWSNSVLSDFLFSSPLSLVPSPTSVMSDIALLLSSEPISFSSLWHPSQRRLAANYWRLFWPIECPVPILCFCFHSVSVVLLLLSFLFCLCLFVCLLAVVSLDLDKI